MVTAILETQSPVYASIKTANKKTGNVAVTSASQSTCPPTCSFKGKGCYAELGPMGIQTSRLNSSSITNPVEIAKLEANEIDKLDRMVKCRVHVVGDCADWDSASLVGAAMTRYHDRTGFPAWTYTHAWRTVPYEAWESLNKSETNNPIVLASIEHPSQVAEAKAMGYERSAMVVNRHPSDKIYEHEGVTVRPCPAESNEKVQCSNCELCMGDTIIKRNWVIGFAVHGGRKNKIKKAGTVTVTND